MKPKAIEVVLPKPHVQKNVEVNLTSAKPLPDINIKLNGTKPKIGLPSIEIITPPAKQIEVTLPDIKLPTPKSTGIMLKDIPLLPHPLAPKDKQTLSFSYVDKWTGGAGVGVMPKIPVADILKTFQVAVSGNQTAVVAATPKPAAKASANATASATKP